MAIVKINGVTTGTKIKINAKDMPPYIISPGMIEIIKILRLGVFKGETSMVERLQELIFKK